MPSETPATSSSRLANPNRAASPQPKRSSQLDDRQRTRLFVCLYLARYINGVKDDDDAFNQDIYEKTLALMEPHWKSLNFDQIPSYLSVCKIWKDFARTGLILPPRLKTKLGPKNSRLAPDDDDDDNSGAKNEPRSLFSQYSVWAIVILCILACMPYITNHIGAQEPRDEPVVRNSRHQYGLKVESHIDDIRSKYPGSLTPKQLGFIRARMEMMKKGVSVLLLLGRTHDTQCKTDRTFCIGRAIANISQYPQFGYIDARDAHLDSHDLTSELSRVLDERNDVMMIDSLDRLPGSEVMSLFQFIDRVETNKRRKGLLLLILYNDKSMDEAILAKMRDAEIVERLLVPKWSRHVRGDTLTSVISRISGTIVRVQ